MNEALAAQLTASAHELTGRVLAQMYEDPFWTARFGDRGRRHATDDGNHHVSYLAQALVANDPEILRNYARWLRSVLVSRGMCSEHLRDNFARLAEAIGERLPEASLAVAYLEEAQRALVYAEGSGHELAEATPFLLRALRPDGLSGSRARAARQDHLEHHLSYLADSLHTGRPELFVAHALWWDRFVRATDSPGEPLAAVLRALALALEAVPGASPAFSMRARATLHAALEALARDGAARENEGLEP